MDMQLLIPPRVNTSIKLDPTRTQAVTKSPAVSGIIFENWTVIRVFTSVIR